MTASPTHQVRTLFKSNLVRVVDYRCSGGRARQEEWPTAHEIVLPRFGAYLRRDASGETVADPSQVLFSNRDQPYEISHPVQGEDRSTVILLDPAAVLEIAGRFDPAVVERPHRPFPRAAIPADPRLHLVQYWLMSLRSPGPNPEPLAVEESLLAWIGAIFARAFTPEPAGPARTLPGTARQHRELARRVRLILIERFHERLLLDDLAAAVYTSPYHLIRVFKSQTGLTVHQYRQQLRLYHAAERLAGDRRENLDRLALDLGFASHSHLTAAFGKAFNLSPSDFRRSVTGRQLAQMSNFLKA